MSWGRWTRAPRVERGLRLGPAVGNTAFHLACRAEQELAQRVDNILGSRIVAIEEPERWALFVSRTLQVARRVVPSL